MNLVVKLDDPRMPAGPATVLESSDEEIVAIRTRYEDKDGCLPAWFRVWRGDGKPGDRVRMGEVMPQLVDVFPGIESGIEARVWNLCERGFSVTLFDVDAHESVHTCRLFSPDRRDAAIEYAKSLVRGT